MARLIPEKPESYRPATLSYLGEPLGERIMPRFPIVAGSLYLAYLAGGQRVVRVDVVHRTRSVVTYLRTGEQVVFLSLKRFIRPISATRFSVCYEWYDKVSKGTVYQRGNR